MTLNALLVTVIGGLLNIVLIVLWAIIRGEVKRTLQDIKNVSIKQTANREENRERFNKLIGCLIRAEDGNPELRRAELTRLIEGK